MSGAKKLYEIMHKNFWDDSDSMTDYFNQAFFGNLYLGDYEKNYKIKETKQSMKVKMVKMGEDIDETMNHRIRGIIQTDDDKYLLIEISHDIHAHICINYCFRIDIAEDYFRNYTKEFFKYCTSFSELAYTRENVIKLLQKFNKNIDDIEFIDDYYIDDFCEEKSFFKLYDSRLKHELKLIELKNIYENNKN